MHSEKPGLYFECDYIHATRLSDLEVTEIRDFLSRYLNKHADIKELCATGRAKASAIVKGLNKLEAYFGEVEEY